MSVPLGGGLGKQRLTASFMVGRLVDSLAMHIWLGHFSDPSEFSDLCFSLAGGIDYAVANNEVPLKAQDLPILVKQVYKHNNHSSLQAAVMALRISVKNACMVGWFQNKDADDLLTLAKEILSTFKDGPHEVKAGYRAIVSDFHILKSTVVPMQNQIALFVAQMDNTDTSTCIMTPPQANFLLNGEGEQGRNNVSMDTGPQLPTNITAMLKCGINLFQAVGQFNGNYLIIVAFMSMMPSTSETPALQNYVQPAVASLDSNSEIIEGLPRVSFNCPISHKRIKTPVKGHLCKHYQCFDYENFMEINSRRPSWHCPHCNQPVCHPDIRIDQDMAKILGEVGENVVDVIISAEGSWMAVLEDEDTTNKTGHETQSCQQKLKRPQQCDSNGFSCVPAEVVDLAVEGANASNAMHVSGSTVRQHWLYNPPCFSVRRNIVRREVNDSDRMNQHGCTQIEENNCSRIPLCISAAPHGSVGGISTWAGTPGISKSSCNSMLSPVLTDTVSPDLNQQSLYVHRKSVPLTSSKSQLLYPSNQQSKQFGLGSSIFSNEYVRLPSIAINAGGISTVAQGLIAQAQVSSSFGQRTLNSSMPTGTLSANYQSPPFMGPNMNRHFAFCAGIDRGQQSIRPHMISLPVSDMASSSMRNHSSTENWDVNKHHYVSGQAVQEAASLPAQGLDGYHISSRPCSGHQNPLQSSARHLRIASAIPKSQNTVPPSIGVKPVQFQQGGGGGSCQAMHNVNGTQTQLKATAELMAQKSRTPPFVPVQLQPSRTGSSSSLSMVAEQLKAAGEQRGSVGETTQPVLQADGSATLASDQKWQSSGRMRGSLTGEAYAAAYNYYVHKPTQPSQISQTSELMSTPHGALQMQGPVSSSSNTQINPQAQSHLRPGGATNCPGSWAAILKDL